MKICYLILAHNNPCHFKRLINTLSSPNSSVFVHIDAKSKLSDFQTEIVPDNVIFLKERVRCCWGGWSLVQATLHLLNEALASKKEHDYYCLLSGSDYPLKSQEYIENFLKEHYGSEFISIVKIPNAFAQIPVDRFSKYHIDVEYNGNNIISRMVARISLFVLQKLNIKRPFKPILNDGNLYGGCQWWGLTHSAVQYIMKYTALNPKFVRFFMNTFIPDESFFQMIVKGSPYKENVTTNLTFDGWSHDLIPYPSPIVDMERLYKIKKDGGVFSDDVYGKGQLLFARKFPDNSDALLEFIHKEIW